MSGAFTEVAIETPGESREAPPVVGYSPAYSSYIVFMFAVVALLSQADRYALAILIDPIKKDLGVSDTMMATVSGLAFAVVFAVAGFPLARLADTGNRRNLLAIAVAVWSAFTALCGAAGTIVQLILARTGLAAAEAAVQPGVMSMIGDIFTPSRRGLATGFMMMGGAVGFGVGSIIVGAVAAAHGWQMAFVVIGLPGILFALIFWLTVPEPPRRQPSGAVETPAKDNGSTWQTLRYLLSVPTAWRLVLASVMLLITQGASGVWLPTFFLRVHEMSLAKMSASFGVFMMIGSIASMVLSGFMSDWVAKRGESWRIRLIGCAMLAGTPFIIAVLLVDNVWVAWGLFVVFQVITAGAPPMIAAAGLGIVKSRARGMWVALYYLAGSLIGSAGPIAVAYMSDTFLKGHGDESLRYALLLIPAMLVPAALIYFWASMTADRDAKIANE